MTRLAGLTWAALFPLIAAIEPPRQPHQPIGNGEHILTWNETTPAAVYAPDPAVTLQWISGAQDGEFVRMSDDDGLLLLNVASNASTVLVAADKIPEDQGGYWISPDKERVLWAVNTTKQFRHSYFADYLVQDVQTGETTPLVPDQAGDILYAEFAPQGGAIAFVRGGDLFLHRNGTITRITENGGPDTFNAVPDWVYEEEIIAGRSALWFSPDAKYLAFLSFNETGVETFRIAYYMDNQKVAPSYPRELELRYPKVSSKNPTVQFNILDLSTDQYEELPITAFTPNNTIIGEVAWVTEDHSAVIYRAFNRVQDHDKFVLVDPVAKSSRVIRERDGSDGWLENEQAIQYVGKVNGTSKGNETYFVTLSDESGWQHIYLYSTAGGEPKALTQGEWEVARIVKVDSKRSLIYYLSTEHHSTERHLYSVNYITGEKKAIVDDKTAAFFSASFSAAGDYYALNYQGPDVPYQELYAVNSTTPLSTLVSNEAFYRNLSSLHLPNITYFELQHPEGFSMNVMERLPPTFDPTKKYPVLFLPYGGPNSQTVTKQFAPLSWNAYVSSDPDLEYITYVVDNRGTGNKGRAFRSLVSKQLGLLETQDQIWAAQQLAAEKGFIDATKMGISGASYGGYLSAKVLEADSDVFSFGFIGSPVTDWRFYDSMYTERYMKTSEDNAVGYNVSAVRRLDGFRDARGGFAVYHGLGDDNVHYQNTAAFVDLLVGGGVSPQMWDLMAFTDSDHGVRYNGAYEWHFRFLTDKLWDEKKRTVDRPELSRAHQWL
jgi:dipeptidyl-peptidase-4